MSIFHYFFLTILLIIYLFFFRKIVSSNIKDIHQKFTTDYIPPLLGGYFIILLFLLSMNISFIHKILYFLIFLTGCLSDFKIVNSPRIRLLFQILIVFFFINSSNLSLENTKIEFLDLLLKNIYFNIFFCIFCITILINGTNFIDGVNGLVSGYYLVVLIVLNQIGFSFEIIDYNFLRILIYLLSILFCLNLFNRIYLGDNGSYLLGFFVGVLLIYIYAKNPYLSPFYIIVLIWYPCFEILFSLLRKINLNSSPLKADNLHLHQLLFISILKKTKLKKLAANNFTSLIIIVYNFIIIMLSTSEYSSSRHQVKILLFNIIFYLLIYLFLKKKLRSTDIK